LQEAAMPLEEYPSLQAFFIRSLKEGSRPIDADPNCLVTGNNIFILHSLFINVVII
jgi:phosphatidylserine decarboxylase